MQTPPVPPREGIRSFNASFMAELTDYLTETTLGPCKEGAHSPSSTALSGAFILGGKVQYFNRGCISKKQPNTSPTEQTIYRLASNSKPFAVETAIQAYLDGKIASLDDELRHYFNDFYINNPFGSGQPTFRQMMSQLSGIPQPGPCINCNITTEEMLERIARYNFLIEKPWTRPSYSNLAFGIFANLISERLYNKPWSKYLEENIANPLNMRSTGMNYTSEVFARMVTNYLLDGSEAAFYDFGWINPAGGVYSTSEDMSLWIMHFLDEWKEDTSLGQLRRNTMMQLFENPGGYSGFGSPWEIFPRSGYLTRTKTGELPGLTTFTAMVPELDLGLVLLWNGLGINTIALGKSLLDSIIPAVVDQYRVYQRTHFPKLSSSFTNQYMGIYHGHGMSATVNVTSVPRLNNAKVATIYREGYGLWYLKPNTPTNNSFVFRVFVEEETTSCYEQEIRANSGEWIFFRTLEDGTKMFTSQFLNFTSL